MKKYETENEQKPASGGCCCGSEKQPKPKVKKETKPSCCMQAEGEEEYPMSITAD